MKTFKNEDEHFLYCVTQLYKYQPGINYLNIPNT